MCAALPSSSPRVGRVPQQTRAVIVWGTRREERTRTADHHDSSHKKDHQSSWDGGQLDTRFWARLFRADETILAHAEVLLAVCADDFLDFFLCVFVEGEPFFASGAVFVELLVVFVFVVLCSGLDV